MEIKVFSHPTTINFIRLCERIKNYYDEASKKLLLSAGKISLPCSLLKEYAVALEEYRDFLDTHRLKMPLKKYPYLYDDETSWKYKDCVITKIVHPVISKWKLNPDFRYKKKDMRRRA